MRNESGFLKAVLGATFIFVTGWAALFQSHWLTPPPEAAELQLGGTRYYVSSSTGRDDWSGTQLRPWKTLTRVSSMTFQPGDQILLKRGDTWKGQGLILQGSGDYRGAWIMVGAYGAGPKPHIVNPPYHPNRSLVDWRAINKAYPKTNRYQIKVALLIQGSSWAIHGLEISHAEMGILSKGELGLRLEDLYIHNIGFDDCGKPLKEQEGGHLLFPTYPNYTQISEETGSAPMWGDASYSPFPQPAWGSAIHISGAEKVTIRNVVIEKATGGLNGWVVEGEIDNVFLDKVATGGLNMEGVDVKTHHATVLNAAWPGKDFAWFGVCVTMSAGSASIEVTDSEIAYTGSVYPIHDACGLEVDSATSGVTWERNFIHHNAGPAFEFGMGGPNQLILVRDNVTYSNGTLPAKDIGLMPEFSIDACPWGAKRVTVRGNQIYKAFPGQHANYYLDFYYSDLRKGFADDWKHAQKHADYVVEGNKIHEPGTYQRPSPIPEPAPQKRNLAPKAKVSVSSGEKTALFANDNRFDTEWESKGEGKPWITLTWDVPRTVDEIWLNDRRDLGNWGVSGVLTLSDGWTMDVTGGILNNGAVRKIALDKPRTIRWLRYQVTRNAPESPGTHVGLGELQVFEPTAPARPALPNLKSTIDFSDRPDGSTLLQGSQYGLDWKNTDWTTRKDPRGDNKYLYIDFPHSSRYGAPTWVLRYITLRWDTTVKSIKIAGPPGATGYLQQLGQEVISFRCVPELTEVETGWNAASARSNLVGIYINVEGVVKPSAEKEGTPADVNDVWFDDIVIAAADQAAPERGARPVGN